MILGIIGTLMVGVTAACLLFVLTRLSRGRIQGWIVPAGSAAAMIVFYIWTDYSWHTRTTASFPNTVEVTKTYGVSFILQPWTLIVPKVNRFTAVDKASIKPNKDLPGIWLTELILVTRYEPTVIAPILIDCNTNRRTFLDDNTEFAENGMPLNVKWGLLDADDGIFEVVCN